MKKYVLVLAVICLASIVCAVPLSTASATADVEYEIYPLPHSVVYNSGNLQVEGDAVSLFAGDSIDEPTINHMYDALSQMDVLVAEGSRAKVYLGVHGSGDAADNFANNLSFSDGLFDKHDAYLLAITTNSILVLGKDTDAAFYGVTTLKAILSQSGKNVRCLQIEDYADGMYRGFIEGYYGIPWTTDERVELMRFGSQFKTNVYVYAPKDDPYHSANWRGLYSETDLAELKEQIVTGTETKTRFVWAIHPFMEGRPFSRGNYQADLNTLLAKFEQLYQAGVRQFALSADDMPNDAIDPVLQKDLCNDITEWINEKGDVKNLIFVPTVYWLAKPDESDNYNGNADYFAQLMGSGATALDESVEIMWTGNQVCSTTNNGKFAEFTQMTGGRKAFMWMNWPVNDYTYSTRDLDNIKPYLLLGKGEVFNTKLAEGEEAAFSGIVVNPLQEAEASKISIFACADYTWNVNGFDADESWKDSFKYIEGETTSDLYELCKHLSSVGSPFGKEGLLEESVELEKVIEKYNEALSSGTNVTMRTIQLMDAFETISRASKNYLENADNLKLKANVGAYAEALGLRAEAAVKYLQIRSNLNTLSNADLATAIDEADGIFDSSYNCKAIVQYLATYNKIYVNVCVAPNVLTPFVEQLAADVRDEAYIKLGRPVAPRMSFTGFDLVSGSSVNNAVDGNVDTYTFFDWKCQSGAYFQLDLRGVTTVNNVYLLMDQNPTGDNYFVKSDEATFLYSADGVSWTEINVTIEDGRIIFAEGLNFNARYVRVKMNYQIMHGFKIHEFSVNKQ